MYRGGKHHYLVHGATLMLHDLGQGAPLQGLWFLLRPNDGLDEMVPKLIMSCPQNPSLGSKQSLPIPAEAALGTLGIHALQPIFLLQGLCCNFFFPLSNNDVICFLHMTRLTMVLWGPCSGSAPLGGHWLKE